VSPLIKHSNGKLAVRSDGKLAKCCGCNDCDPPLKCSYEVTFSGLAGDFAFFNGTTRVDCYGACVYLARDGDYDLWLIFWPEEGWGSVINFVDAQCQMRFLSDAGISEACDPTAGTCSIVACNDAGCADGDSCGDSSGATCVISEVSA